jgi:hypothetical protein
MGSDLGIVETPGFFGPRVVHAQKKPAVNEYFWAKGLFLAASVLLRTRASGQIPGISRKYPLQRDLRTAMMEDMERFVDLLESALLEMRSF